MAANPSLVEDTSRTQRTGPNASCDQMSAELATPARTVGASVVPSR